ncbi:hypothetical protein, partial [Nostoc sp. ChiQUE01b]|uniref:hypothetical protein n=1 Tax=Nostoc sp. ChiQUE01b TaxID=3075376 RepID=UPI002AD42E27
ENIAIGKIYHFTHSRNNAQAMSKVRNVGELTELLEQAKRSKTEREKRKLESTRTPQKAEDRTIVYYRDPIVANRIFEIAVPKSNLEKFGGGVLATGVTAAGLTLDAPTGNGIATPIQIMMTSPEQRKRLRLYTVHLHPSKSLI